MGRLVTNPPKPVVRVKVAQTNFKGILNLAQTVHDLTLANIAVFATPTPTSIALQSDIDALRLALSSIGTKSNRGGVNALNAVKAAAFTVFSDLTQRAAYVTTILDGSTSPADQALVLSQSGFASKSKKSKIPTMQFVTKVRQTNNKQFPQTLRRVNWRKSLGLFRGTKIRSFNIYAIAAAGAGTQLIASTTKTNFFVPLTANFGALQHPVAAVMIKPVSASGEGNGFMINIR